MELYSAAVLSHAQKPDSEQLVVRSHGYHLKSLRGVGMSKSRRQGYTPTLMR